MSVAPQQPTLRENVDAIARSLRDAYVTKRPRAPIRHGLPAHDVGAAYAVQAANTAYWRSAGRRIVGRKIGLTAEAVQRQLGVDRPDLGVLFADMNVPCDGEAATHELLQPRIEAEIAFVLARPFPQGPLTVADAIGAVAYALPALEIVDSRIANWDIDIVDTIADNASSSGFVLGERPVRLEDFDAAACGMTLRCDGAVVSVGVGAACLGHPLRALLWLAEAAQSFGEPLAAGDIILSGALGPMVTVTPGRRYDASIAGLGPVAVRFAPVREA